MVGGRAVLALALLVAAPMPAVATDVVQVEGWSPKGKGRQVELLGADGASRGWYDLSGVDPSLILGWRRINPELLLVELPKIGWVRSSSLNVRFCEKAAPGEVTRSNHNGARSATQMGSGTPCGH